MTRTITVKGIGKVTAKPDQVVISMTLEALDKDYEKAMNRASDNLAQLSNLLCYIGFEKEDLKTTNFNVDTDYESERDSKGNYRQIFRGYLVTHDLKLAFDFDVQMLAKALTTVSKCISNPRLSIAFTVKDETAIKEEMLRSAAANARRKAEILCAGSGVQLGELLTINYNWGEINVYSRTQYDNTVQLCMRKAPKSMDINPDDIEVSDTATFVWEIR
ncbi:MAG TPA: SIMPL domain-containing protein [Erysipelotrichaceae bacterium]|nr:SIMPL domain-containing protein [Erysipelotrichaceae bacterium]